MSPINPLRQLSAFGQSVWYDNIQRSLLNSGQLSQMIAGADLRGITSNPAIFEKAIGNSTDYDEALRCEQRRDSQQSSRALFFSLAIEDIREAAKALYPVYGPHRRHRPAATRSRSSVPDANRSAAGCRRETAAP